MNGTKRLVVKALIYSSLWLVLALLWVSPRTDISIHHSNFQSVVVEFPGPVFHPVPELHDRDSPVRLLLHVRPHQVPPHHRV